MHHNNPESINHDLPSDLQEQQAMPVEGEAQVWWILQVTQALSHFRQPNQHSGILG